MINNDIIPIHRPYNYVYELLGDPAALVQLHTAHHGGKTETRVSRKCISAVSRGYSMSYDRNAIYYRYRGGECYGARKRTYICEILYLWLIDSHG